MTQILDQKVLPKLGSNSRPSDASDVTVGRCNQLSHGAHIMVFKRSNITWVALPSCWQERIMKRTSRSSRAKDAVAQRRHQTDFNVSTEYFSCWSPVSKCTSRRRFESDTKKRHLSDSNTRGQSPTAVLIAGDPVNHSGKVTSCVLIQRSCRSWLSGSVELNDSFHWGF